MSTKNSAQSVIIDLTNYKDKSSAHVPEGQYHVVIEDAETTTSRNGNPMIVVYLRISGGASDGLNIVDRLTMSENAMFRVVGFLQALGMPTPKKRLSVPLRQIIGRRVDVVLGDGDPYNGVTKSEVRQYVRPVKNAGFTEPTLSDDDEFEIDEEETEIEETEVEEAPVKKAKKRKPAPEPEPEDDDEDDDDIDLDDIEI